MQAAPKDRTWRRRAVIAIALHAAAWLTACGGGGNDAPDAAAAAVTTAARAAAADGSQATGTSVVMAAGLDALRAALVRPAAAVPLTPPQWPRSGITAAELAVVVIEGDALSEAIGREYQRQYQIPDANLVRVPLPSHSDLVSEADFQRARARFEADVPRHVQASVLAFARPSRVLGAGCAMSITSAMAFGYSADWCGGCARTRASPLHDSETTRPWTDFGVRPSMLLPARSLAEAGLLIARGMAAQGSNPRATAVLVRTADAARSVRYPDMQGLAAAWTGLQGLLVRYLDNRAAESPATAGGSDGVLFHFTGATRVEHMADTPWLPGAVADHLTSYGGMLPDANGQMPATDWLWAGATASYGSVEEPCNFEEKFPRASLVVAHYLRGATVIEAYWKSVAWPGQGLFVGDPLARPYAHAMTAAVDAEGTLQMRSGALRPGARYQLQWQGAAGQGWNDVATVKASVPAPADLRIALPAAWGRLRWLGPCATDADASCEIASSP